MDTRIDAITYCDGSKIIIPRAGDKAIIVKIKTWPNSSEVYFESVRHDSLNFVLIQYGTMTAFKYRMFSFCRSMCDKVTNRR